MATKTGVPSLIQVARRMCKLITAFSPIIRRVYPDNEALLLALDAAMTACSVLDAELEAVREYGT